MRYIINDDDLEYWYKLLSEVFEKDSEGISENGKSNIKYIIDELASEISDGFREKSNQCPHCGTTELLCGYNGSVGCQSSNAPKS